MRRSLPLSAIVLILLLSACPSYGLLYVDGYVPEQHERFVNDGSFIGAGLDFSGVARSNDNGFWATMISPRRFVSAGHAHANGTVVFYHDNDPGGATTTRTVVGGKQIGNTDIWVGWLDAPVDETFVAVYDIAPNLSYDGETSYQVGRGTKPDANADNTTGFRVGRNVFSGVYDDVELTTGGKTYVTDSLVYFDDSQSGDLTDPPKEQGGEYVADETFLQGGDSGGPSFLIGSGGELVLVGAHSFITEPDPDDPDSPFSQRRASGDAYLPAYRDAILSAVPEASPALLLWGAALLALICQRRRGPRFARSP